MRTLRWMLILVLATLMMAACGRDDKVTAEQIMDGMRQAREKTQDVHAVAEVVTSGTQEDGKFVTELWMRKSGETDAAGKPIAQSRAKVLETSRAELLGTEMVNDGATVWIYNPDRNTVITGKIADLKQGAVGAQDPTAQMLRMQEQLQQVLDGSDVEILAENEPVAGLDAWKVKLTPKPETTQQMGIGSVIETTLWIDHEHYVPLKGIMDAKDLGRVDMTVRQIDVDKGIDPATFAFTPPPSADVIDAAELARNARPTTTTLDEARETTSFALLAPATLPEGVVLDEVQKLGMGGETVIQNYSGTLAFSLVQTKGDENLGDREAPAGAQIQQVTVRGQEAALITGSGTEQGVFLRWQENGITVVIAGALSADQAQAIAASLR